MNSISTPDVTKATDGELIRRYLNEASQRSFTDLVARYHGMVMSVANRKLQSNTELARDAAQTVFVILARNVERLSRWESVEGWLYRTTVYVCWNLGRKESRLKSRERIASSVGQAYEQERSNDDWAIAREVVDDLILDLPVSMRDVVTGHYATGLTEQQLADREGCSRNTVHKRLRLARERLRRGLTRRGIVVSMTVLTAGLEAEAKDLPIADLSAGDLAKADCRLPIGENAEVPERIQTVADAVMAEMDRAAAKAMWKIGAVAAGLATIGIGTVLVVNHFQASPSATTQPVLEVSWWIESVLGNPSVRRCEMLQVLKTGDPLCIGDTILTTSNQEVAVVSDGGDRILLREDSELRLETVNGDTNSAGSGDPAYKDYRRSNVGRVTSRGGIPISDAIQLTKGAIVAQVKRSTRFATSHAGIETVGADFFLMVANGLTTNGTPWSFSRIDVTEGEVRFRSSPPPKADPPVADEFHDPSFEFPVSPLQFAAFGTDPEKGELLEGVVRRSVGKELSPRYGGVFYREFAEIYETNRFVLDTLDFRKGSAHTFGPSNLLAAVVNKTPGVELTLGTVKTARGTVSVLKMQTVTPNVKQVVEIGVPSINRGAFMIEYGMVFKKLSPSGSCAYGQKNIGIGDLPLCKALSTMRNVVSEDRKPQESRLCRIEVGMLASGDAVFEEGVDAGGKFQGTDWVRGDVSEVRLTLVDTVAYLESVTVTELTRLTSALTAKESGMSSAKR